MNRAEEDAHKRARIAAILAAKRLGIGDHEDRCDLASMLLKREIRSWNQLSITELITLRLVYDAYAWVLHQRRENGVAL